MSSLSYLPVGPGSPQPVPPTTPTRAHCTGPCPTHLSRLAGVPLQVGSSCCRASAHAAAATGCRHGLGLSLPAGRWRRRCLACPARGRDWHQGLDAIRPSSGACTCLVGACGAGAAAVCCQRNPPGSPWAACRSSKRLVHIQQQIAGARFTTKRLQLLRRRTASASTCYRPRWLRGSLKGQSRHVPGLSSRVAQCKRRCSSDTPSSQPLRCASAR